MPFTRLRKVIIEEPKHIVDLIWTEAKIELANSTKKERPVKHKEDGNKHVDIHSSVEVQYKVSTEINV